MRSEAAGPEVQSNRIGEGKMLVAVCGLVTALSWLTPSDVLTHSASLATFVASMQTVFPAIRAFSELSPHGEVVAFVLAVMWALFPVLLWINATKVHTFESWQPNHMSGLKGYLSLVTLTALVALCAWLIGFYQPASIQGTQGRANAFLYGLTQSRTGLGILSSLTFLAITWFCLALARGFRLMRSSWS